MEQLTLDKELPAANKKKDEDDIVTNALNAHASFFKNPLTIRIVAQKNAIFVLWRSVHFQYLNTSYMEKKYFTQEKNKLRFFFLTECVLKVFVITRVKI